MDASEPAKVTRGLADRAFAKPQGANGRARRTPLSPTVAEETTIVFLYPLLEWDASHDWVVLRDRAIAGAGAGLPTRASAYRTFVAALDDNPADVQAVARRARRGQQRFRDVLLHAYDHACAISGWRPPAVLDAVHIEPHAIGGINDRTNGLLPRADLHSLFDDGL